MTLREEFEQKVASETTNKLGYIFQSNNSNYIKWLENIIYNFEKEEISTECNCCYMTTGEHSGSCPQRLFS